MNNRERIELGISLNNSCNFHCQMCHIWSQDKSENLLNLEKCCSVIEELSKFKVKTVRLSGGDPLLTPWALDLATYIHKKGYSCVVTTNGSMIIEFFAQRIINAGISNLNLSLDGYTAAIHDRIRGATGSYQKIIEAIGYLSIRSNGLHVGINTVISDLNLDEIIPLMEMVQADTRIDHIYFMAVMQPFGTPLDHKWFQKDNFLSLWPKDIKKIDSLFEALINFKKSGYKINNSFAQLRTFRDYFINPLDFTKKNKCTLGREAMEINQLGDVYLCYNHESIGNIFNESLYNIWQSEKADRVRGRINDCRQNCNLLINCYFEDEDV